MLLRVSRETWWVAVGVGKRGVVFHVKRLVGKQGKGFHVKRGGLAECSVVVRCFT